MRPSNAHCSHTVLPSTYGLTPCLLLALVARPTTSQPTAHVLTHMPLLLPLPLPPQLIPCLLLALVAKPTTSHYLGFRVRMGR